MNLDELRLPPEYPKPRFVVPDNMVDAMREAFGDAAEIIPVSETMLPANYHQLNWRNHETFYLSTDCPSGLPFVLSPRP